MDLSSNGHASITDNQYTLKQLEEKLKENVDSRYHISNSINLLTVDTNFRHPRELFIFCPPQFCRCGIISPSRVSHIRFLGSFNVVPGRTKIQFGRFDIDEIIRSGTKI